jgi:hypothetical protein
MSLSYEDNIENQRQPKSKEAKYAVLLVSATRPIRSLANQPVDLTLTPWRKEVVSS